MENPRHQTPLSRALVDAVEEYAIVALCPDGTVQTWNSGAEQMTGYAPTDILGEHVSVLYTAEAVDAGEPDEHLAVAARSSSLQDEGWRMRADGTPFWATVTITALRDAAGELEGFATVTRDTTSQRATERQLEAQADRLERQRDELERELQEVFERISDGFYALDESLRFRYVNDHARSVLGLEDAVAGVDIRDEVVLTDAFEAALYEALETQSPVIMEDYYDPVGRWFTNAIYPSATGLSVYFRDVTERKQRERELTRYETTVETLWDGMTTLDADDRFVMVNEAFCEMTGYERDELLGAHASLVIDEVTLEEAVRLTEQVSNGDLESATIEYGLQTANGGTIPVEARFGPCEVEDGTDGGTGVIRDIRDRKERERTLERRARQQRTVAALGQFALDVDELEPLMAEATRQVANALDTPFCKVLDFDADRGALRLSQGVGWREGLVGSATVSADEVDSQAAYTLVHDHPVVVENLEAETRFRGPELLRNHDVRSGISTVIGPFDEPWGILSVHDTEPRVYSVEDVDFVQSVANVLAEAIERHRYRAELEGLVDDLRASNERLEQFAYAASHDLQEPLRMVTSYLQLVERRYGNELDDDGVEFLEFAVDGADRMREMIDGLLAYSRVESQGDPFELVDLADVLDAVRADLRVKVEDTGAKIVVEELPRVEGDGQQLHQVFLNLLDNALSYAGASPPRVYVSAGRAGDEWIVSVRDEGVGIDPAHADRVFEVFERLTTTDEHPGTGIGLALVKRVVERHGGELWVDSEPGEGTTFSFTLPVAT